MIISSDRSGTIEGLQNMFGEMTQEQDVKGLIILACDANGFTPESLDGILKSVPIPIFGGVFPAIVHGQEVYQTGTIIVGLKTEPDVRAIEGLSDPGLDYEEELGNLDMSPGGGTCMFVLFDGYSQRISPFVDSLYTLFGLDYTYIGGGAGSINPSALDMSGTPCLITNNGLLKDGAILAVVDMKCSVGAKHGWRKISGPYKVTESEGNAILSIDWRPAFEVYREIIQAHSQSEIRKDNFFEIAKYFPFGINRLGAEIIVRDPFSVKEDCLLVATEIPQESFIDILTGDTRTLVSAAEQSFEDARAAYPGTETECTFLIDCISRALFLDDEFELELDAVSRDGLPLIGILSLGEIANSGKSFMELLNKTCVIGLLGES